MSSGELGLPEDGDDFFSWLVGPADWFPEATAAPPAAADAIAGARAAAPPAAADALRPLSPLHLAALAWSSDAALPHPQPALHDPAGAEPPGGASAADHIRHAASGFSRVAASVWASLGMAPPASAAAPPPSVTSPDLLAVSGGGGGRGASAVDPFSLDAAAAGGGDAPPERRSGNKRRRGGDGAGGGGSAARGAAPEALTLEDARRQIDLLTAENTALRAQLRAVSTASTKDSLAQERERQRQLGRIRALAAAGDAEVRHAVLRFKDLHSDFGKDRWVALRHHLSCLRSLLTPSLLTKVCTWGIEMQGADGDAAASASATTVWAGVSGHAHMDAEQRRRLLGLRDAARVRRADFEAAIRQLRVLEEAVTRNFTGLEGHMSRLMGSINPVQIALVLDWVDSNADSLAAIAPLDAWPHEPGAVPPPMPGAASDAVGSSGRPRAAS